MKLFTNAFLIVILAAAAFQACRSDEATGIPLRMPEMSFKPDIEAFTGKPGDVLELNVIIDGESNFTSFYILKFEEEAFLDMIMIEPEENGEIPVPYEHNFSYELTEAEVGQTIILTFVMQASIALADGSRVINNHQKELTITTEEDMD